MRHKAYEHACYIWCGEATGHGKGVRMLTEYIQAAMRGRTFEVRPDGAFCVEIPSFWGAYAHAKRLETCGTPLHEAAEGWIVLGLHFGDLLPVVRQVLGLAIPGL